MTNLAELSNALAELAEKAGPALASLPFHGRTRSAFHWKDGFYLAAESAVETDEAIELTLADGSTVNAEVAGRDPSSGIVLLKAGKAAASFANAAPVRPGNVVLVVGRTDASPLASFGSVNEAGPNWRSMRGGLIDRRLGLAVPVDGRFEGGPVLDAEGKLVGMMLFGPRRRVLVIPTETIDRVAAVLREKGHVARGYLGAGLHPVRHASVQGAMVMSLDESGPAQAAGIQLGDIVTAWNGEPVRGPRGLVEKLSPDSVGTEVTLTIRRGGAEQTVAVTIGARPVR
jgi:S1-C subfamily serine protease